MSLRTNTGGRQSKTGGKYHLQDTVVKNDNTLLPTNSTLSSKESNETSVVNGVHVIELELLTTQELLPSVDTKSNTFSVMTGIHVIEPESSIKLETSTADTTANRPDLSPAVGKETPRSFKYLRPGFVMTNFKRPACKLAMCAAGIFVFYFLYGLLQEKIMRGVYGPQAEKFTYPTTLVFVQCVVNYAFAWTVLAAFPEEPADTTRRVYYVGCAVTYLLGMVSSNMALQWVNYPTQAIAKSCKPIPIMILGVLLGSKSYSLKKYLFVLTVVIGVALFMFKDGKSESSKSESMFGVGEILLLVSLTMDGLTGAVQERMRSESQTKSRHMMVNINMWSIFIIGIAIIATGEVFGFIGFVQRHPEITVQLLLISACSAVGQFFIFWTVSDFGTLPCSIVTTTRKFFTVLASVVFFGNPLLTRQWIATGLVFAGLFLDSFFGR